MDLVGFDKHCLIRPRQMKKEVSPAVKTQPKKKKSIRNVHKKKKH